MTADDRSGGVWAVAIIFLIVSWLAVGLRIYVRVEQIGKFGLDDQLVIASQIFFTGYLACQLGGVVHGTGRHLSDLTYANAEIALRFWYFCEVWYAISSSLVKVSICLSLRRVTVRTFDLFAIYGLIIWSSTLGLSFLLVVIFQCIPTNDWWDLNPAHKNCIAPHVLTSLTYAVSALTVACDWTLGLFPFWIVKDLAIPTSQKIMVASILAFGALASTATIVRMFYVEPLEESYSGWNGDFLYSTTPVAVWTTVEVGVGITATCLSTLRPLLAKIRRIFFPTTHDSHPRGYPGVHRLEDDSAPISLVDSPSIASPNVEFPSSHDNFAGVTRFNGTKPLTGRYGVDMEDYYNKSSAPQDFYANGTRFNATRALDSSFSELEDNLEPIAKRRGAK